MTLHLSRAGQRTAATAPDGPSRPGRPPGGAGAEGRSQPLTAENGHPTDHQQVRSAGDTVTPLAIFSKANYNKCVLQLAMLWPPGANPVIAHMRLREIRARRLFVSLPKPLLLPLFSIAMMIGPAVAAERQPRPQESPPKSTPNRSLLTGREVKLGNSKVPGAPQVYATHMRNIADRCPFCLSLHQTTGIIDLASVQEAVIRSLQGGSIEIAFSGIALDAGELLITTGSVGEPEGYYQVRVIAENYLTDTKSFRGYLLVDAARLERHGEFMMSMPSRGESSF
jgi:hypothetical protein